MRVVVRLFATTAVFWAVLSVAPGPSAGAAKWDPIDPKDLAATQPTVDKDADAEALLWEVGVADETGGGDSRTVFSQHLLIKVFTDHGRDVQSRVDLEHGGSVRIQNLEARAVRRDGSFTELKKADVFERTVAKAGGFKVKATSFAFPAVEAGGIVEYRWREVYPGIVSQNLRLPLSRNIPVRLVRYRLVPLNLTRVGLVLQGRAFHPNQTLKMGTEQGFTVVSMEDVAAHSDEAYAPPDWDTQPWMLIYYDRLHPASADDYWKRYAEGLAAGAREAMSPTPEIQRAADALALGAATTDQKLSALVTFCRAKIKRLDVDTATDADRKGFKGNGSFTAALAAGRGTANDVLGLFVALARAAGLDARLARIPSRNDVAFERTLMLSQLTRDVIVAVRDGDRWRFADPTNDHAPGGHLSWTQELVPALVGDADSLLWVTTPAAPPEWSLRSRTATFRLSEDGTLEGDVAAEIGGHLGMHFKEQDDNLAPAEREAALRDSLTLRLPGAEVTEVRIDNVADPEKPYIDRYHLKVPGYAQRTGSRLFIQPAVLQKGIPPAFAEAERRFPVFFDHAWKEVDRVRIELPDGYRLESPNAPSPVSFTPFGGYTVTLVPAADGRAIEMTREFFFGGGERLQFPAESYSPLKQFFDGVAKADGQTLTLRKVAGAGGRPR